MCRPELHVIGVYESDSISSGDNHPLGTATVHIERQGSSVLALSSYEPIHWTVTAAPGVVLEKVILNGFYEQTATAPDGVPVESFSGPSGWLGAFAYAWPSDDQGGDTPALVSAVEKVAGRELSSFHGCYHATSFTLHDNLGAESDCAVAYGDELDSYTSPALNSCGDDPAEPCANQVGTGKYVGWSCDDGHWFILTLDISCNDALENCKLNASLNPNSSFHCEWNGQVVHEVERTAGICDNLSPAP